SLHDALPICDPFVAADPAHALVGLSLAAHVGGPDPECARESLPHRLCMRTDTRTFTDHRDIDVHDLVVHFLQPVTRGREQPDRICVPPALVARREMRADVTKTGGA